jgi:hypothetical protein
VSEFVSLDGVMQAPEGAVKIRMAASPMAAGQSHTGTRTLARTSFRQ